MFKEILKDRKQTGSGWENRAEDAPAQDFRAERDLPKEAGRRSKLVVHKQEQEWARNKSRAGP